MLIRVLAAASAAAFFIVGPVAAHPNDLDTWQQYKAAKLAEFWKHPPQPESLAAVWWLDNRDKAVRQLHAEWERFDAAYWASLEPEPVNHVHSPEPVGSSGSVDWYAIMECEDNDNPDAGPTGWASNTANGYWGGLQFAPSTWFGYGGGPFSGSGPFPYSAGEQIAVAERVLAGQGIGAWPHCGAYG